MRKFQAVRDVLGKLNHRGKAFWHEGTLKNLDERISKYGDDAARQNLKPEQLSRYNDLVSRRASTFAKYQPHADEWAKYTQGMGKWQQRGANLAGNLTGAVYDMPRGALGMPSSRLGIIGSIPAFMLADSVGLNPFDQAGGIAYNTFGNPEADVKAGFQQGVEGAVGQSLQDFTSMGYQDRRKFLNGGGYGGQGMMSNDAIGAFNGTGAVAGPGTFKTVLTGNYSPEFYRRQALEKAAPQVSGYFNKQGSTSGHIKMAFSLTKVRGWAGKAKEALNPANLVRTSPYVNKAEAAEKVSRFANFNDKYGRLALPVGIGGALTVGAYGSAKDSAQQGGMQAGQETAMYGMQQGLKQMPMWQRELAALFPNQAAQIAAQKYAQFAESGFKGAPSAQSMKHGGPVQYGYYQADGNFVY